MKKLSAIILTAIMVLTLVLASCGETTESPASKPPVGDESQTASVGEESAEDKPLVPHLDPTDAGVNGYTLKVLACGDGDGYAFTQFTGKTAPGFNDEFNEDAVNIAVLNRNYKLEAEYGFRIEAVNIDQSGLSVFTRIEDDYLGGTIDYQVISAGAYRIAPAAVAGYLVDIYDIEDSYLSLNEEWWDPVAQKDMSIGNRQYMITGDLLVTDDEYIKCIYFNKDMVEKYKADPAFAKTPYDLVYDGEWTLDKMYEMVKAVAHDGGDDRMHPDGEDDTWGLVGVAFDTYMLIMGSGKPQVRKNADDIPEFAMLDEANVNAFLKVYDIVTDTQRVALREAYYEWNDKDGNAKIYNSFYDERALFMMGAIEKASSPEMRDLNFHYGILPYPKYNEEQEHYASTVDPYGFGVIGISNYIEKDELKQVTFCLEAMAYLNHEEITPEYYVRTLKMKRLDDNESPDMLDLISRNRLVDISVVFNWNDCIQYYNTLYSKHNNQVESFCQGKEGVFNSAMQETLDAFEALGE